MFSAIPLRWNSSNVTFRCWWWFFCLAFQAKTLLTPKDGYRVLLEAINKRDIKLWEAAVDVLQEQGLLEEVHT